MNKKHLVLVLPSLSSGGMERVMTQLAWHFTGYSELEVTLLIMTRNEKFYELPPQVRVIEPEFDYRKYSRFIFSLKILHFVRKTLKLLRPDAVLSFGGKYNAFVLLASHGLGTKVFISDRSRPSISYGPLQDRLNPLLYRSAAGIIAQSQRAKNLLDKTTGNPNIRVIGNPIRQFTIPANLNREKIILNVGRFIPSKKQEWLIDYFEELGMESWKLLFLGEGPEWERVKKYAAQKNSSGRIIFAGNVRDVDPYYLRASIFALPTLSEGFPNALGEAMRAGLACISFDCEAGPSDLIDHDLNGFLVAPSDHVAFKHYLKQLTEDKMLRDNMGMAARRKLEQYDPEHIGRAFYEFIFPKS